MLVWWNAGLNAHFTIRIHAFSSVSCGRSWQAAAAGIGWWLESNVKRGSSRSCRPSEAIMGQYTGQCDVGGRCLFVVPAGQCGRRKLSSSVHSNYCIHPSTALAHQSFVASNAMRIWLPRMRKGRGSLRFLLRAVRRSFRKRETGQCSRAFGLSASSDQGSRRRLCVCRTRTSVSPEPGRDPCPSGR